MMAHHVEASHREAFFIARTASMRAWKGAGGARLRPDVSRVRRPERTRHRDLHLVRQPARARRRAGRRGQAAGIAGSAQTGASTSASAAAAETAAAAAPAGQHRAGREELSHAFGRMRGTNRRRLRRDRVHRRDRLRGHALVVVLTDAAPARDAAPSAPMKIRSALAIAGLALAFAAPALAQTAPPAPAATAVPWRPRPVIIIDPSPYLASPSPRPHAKHRPTPRPHVSRRPQHRPTQGPEIFERHDTAPPPTTPPRAP